MDNENTRRDAWPERLLDVLNTVWVLTVATAFYGGYLFPDAIGRWTAMGDGIFAGILSISAIVLARRYWNRGKAVDAARSQAN
ncbi:MAG: hypothetical protein ACLQVD_13120 [Capsulimonadaceae bacterium]